jgi:glycosyltransferase involved in cell wall biosynthesis
MQASSNALTLDRARSAERAAVVLQFGPALSVRGGVSTVEQLIVDHVRGIELRHVATMVDNSRAEKLGMFLRALVTLRSELREPRRTLVHIHFASRGSTLRKMLLAKMVLRARQPLILHAHGAAFDRFFNGLPPFLRRIVRDTLSRADRVVVLSSQWRDFFVREVGVPERKVVILYNPTSLPRELPARTGRTRVQFLFLGRIGERKGAMHLLQAFGQLPVDLRARAHLIFAGDGEVDALRMAARELGEAVQVHSWVDTVQRDALLAESDVFVLPSFQEGVPMAMLEAMAYGLPVITTPVGGIPDVVTDGTEGYLIAPGDVGALTRAMAALIENESLRLTLGTNARTRAERFDVEHFAAELTGIYRTLLNRSQEAPTALDRSGSAVEPRT